MAEIVDYDVIGAKPKQSDNVVGYNFREEQSIADFSKTNANNQTSTGQADIVYGVNRPKIIAETSIVGGVGGGGLKIIEVSDYQSISEWQPIADRVLGGEFVVVNCMFTEYSTTRRFYFIPAFKISNRIVYIALNFGSSTWHALRISLRMESGDGKTITSIATADYTK